MTVSKSKRNIKIEIIRIIACIAVIWYHIRELPWKINGELSETAIFFECLCTICVMTFFLITGFFIYNMKGSIFSDWLKLIKKFLITIFIPFIIICVITIIFHDFFISTNSFLGCIKKIDLSAIFYTILFSIRDFDVVLLPGTAAHLWYIFSYATIIIAYPITRFILTKLPKYITYILIAIFTIFMVVNDYYLFYGNPIYNTIFKIVHKPIYYSVWGYVLYNDIIKKYIDDQFKKIRNKDKIFIINKKIFVISSLLYVITFILLFLTEVNYDLGTNSGYVYTSWLSTYSLVLTSAFILFVYNLNLDRFINNSIEMIISFISSKSFYIYLIHYLIITKLLSIGLQSVFTRNRPNIIFHFLYYILYGTFIFVSTLIVVCLINILIKSVKMLLKIKRD